jgi:hypothetical protein
MATTTRLVRTLHSARFHSVDDPRLTASSKRCWTMTPKPVLPTGAKAAIQRPWYSPATRFSPFYQMGMSPRADECPSAWGTCRKPPSRNCTTRTTCSPPCVTAAAPARAARGAALPGYAGVGSSALPTPRRAILSRPTRAAGWQSAQTGPKDDAIPKNYGLLPELSHIELKAPERTKL